MNNGLKWIIYVILALIINVGIDVVGQHIQNSFKSGWICGLVAFSICYAILMILKPDR